jgi:predicted DNA-binding protein (MmcQ/YjbR family)
MTLESVQEICRQLHNVTEDIKWEHDYCFNVGGKMFLVMATNTVPLSASFKVSEEVFEEMTEKEGFKPAPYLARHKWIHVDNISRLSKKEWTHFIHEAYRLAASKLTKKKK